MKNDINEEKLLLPEPSLRRLPWYLAYINTLKASGVETVSSTQISHAIGVDASQIAKDLSLLNIKGKTRIGYDVVALAARLADFLGFHAHHNALIVGTGSLGAALIQDRGLSNYGLDIVAGFDISPDLIGAEICGVKIYSPEVLREVRKLMGATIGILCVPADKAQESADMLVAAGIKAIWNFTPSKVKVRPGIVLANTSIYAHLAIIYNRMANS